MKYLDRPINILFTGLSLWLIGSVAARAQIIPDRTLPNPTTVTVTDNNSLIDGGTQSGSNLFHSFQEFSLPSGRATFNNASDIQNIITRITGDRLSEINGMIKAMGSANLFLINPRGFIFGENASLDVGGSVAISTADRVLFPNNLSFGIDDQNSILLSSENPTGLGFGAVPGTIENRSWAEVVANSRLDLSKVVETNFTDKAFGLSVLPDRTLAIVGGNVQLIGGNLSAIGGRIELGSVINSGIVTINSHPQGWQLDYTRSPQLGTISLVNRVDQSISIIPSIIYAGGVTRQDISDPLSRGGSIQIYANLFSLRNSRVVIANFSNLAACDLDIFANDIQLIGTISQDQSAGIANTVELTGNGGSINIDTDRLLINKDPNFMINGFKNVEILAASFGDGSAGDIHVVARDWIRVQGFSSLVTNSLGNGQSTNRSIGNAGNIQIRTGALELQGRSSIESQTQTSGQAGNIEIVASQVVRLTEGSEILANSKIDEGSRSSLINYGNAGDITIQSPRIEVISSLIESSSLTNARGGQISLQANSINIQELYQPLSTDLLTIDSDPLVSGILSRFECEACGNFSPGLAGNISIQTNQLLVGDRAQISTNTRSQASTPETDRAGNITIQANRIVLSGAGQITSLSQSRGNELTAGRGGNITIQAGEIQAIGAIEVTGDLDKTGNESRIIPSGITTQSRPVGSLQTINPATGDAGNVTIQADRLVVRDGAAISSDTFGTGQGGSVQITAGQIEVTGRSELPSSRAVLAAFGDSDGALPSRISAATRGSGRGGDVAIAAQERLLIRDGGLVSTEARQPDGSETLTLGAAGNLQVRGDLVRVTTGGRLLVRSDRGEGGTLGIDADSLQLFDRGEISATAGQAQQSATLNTGGNIQVRSRTLAGLRNSDITANSFGGPGGNITIQASDGAFGFEQPARQNLGAFAPGASAASEIVAFSSADPSLDGTVTVFAPQLDPAQGAIVPLLPEDATTLQNPCTLVADSGEFNELVDGGRGGLALHPLDPLQLELAEDLNPDPPPNQDPIAAPREAQGFERRGGVLWLSESTASGIPYPPPNPDRLNRCVPSANP